MDTFAEINSCGYRGAELKENASLRILAVGGSTTFDTGVDSNERTWCEHLEKQLSVYYPNVEVINGGLPVYALWANALKFMMYDYLLQPDVVLIYQGINDMSPWWATSLAEVRKSDYWLFKGVSARRWAGIEGAVCFLPRAPVAGLLSRSVFLMGAFNVRGENTNIFSGMDHAKSVDDAVPAPVIEQNVFMLQNFINAIRRTGAVPIFVPQAIGVGDRRNVQGIRSDIWNQGLRRLNDNYIACCRRMGAKILDVTAVTGRWGDEYFRDTLHFNNEGAQKFAVLLAEVLAHDSEVRQRFTSNSESQRRSPTDIPKGVSTRKRSKTLARSEIVAQHPEVHLTQRSL
jgi:lysophospholipase L1-like esterase